jgi:hypothetical protein
MGSGEDTVGARDAPGGAAPSRFADGPDAVDSAAAEAWRDELTTMAASARRAGRRAVASGRWLADTVVDLAPRIPVRSAESLAAHHGGLQGRELARSVVRGAGRVSGGIGAATGGLVTAQELSVAGLVVVPFELAAATALVVATEIKLVTELHHVAARPLPGGRRGRTEAAIVSWMSGRAAPPTPASATVRGDLLGRAGRQELRATLRRRFTRNLSALGPLLTGAAAAGYLNRRATLDVGTRVADDLGLLR